MTPGRTIGGGTTRGRLAPPAPLVALGLTLGLAASLGVTACGDGPSTPIDPTDPTEPTDPTDSTALRIEVDGRLERGGTLTLRTLEDDESVPRDSVAWSAEPPDAVVFPTDSTAHLLAAGTVVLTAEARGATAEAELDVAVPPTIVFDLLADGNRDIHRIALDGGDAARLTTDPADDRTPTAVGGIVVFTSYRDGNAELYAVPLSGGDPVRLTATAANETEPALSPDGERLAFISDDTGVGKLWLADADGGGAARLTTGLGRGGSIEATPSWAPSSDRIVYLSTENGDADLFAVTLAGEQSSLVAHDSADVEPAWSPDGEYVAFASNRDGPTELYLLEVATGDVVRLTEREETDAHPAWTADARLVYSARVDGEARLRWLDPAAPAEVRPIPIGPGTPGRPTVMR